MAVEILPYVIAYITRKSPLSFKEEVLLTYRIKADFGCNTYAMVGGKIDEGEAPIQAIVREAYEEVGISIDPGTVEMVHVLYFKGATRVCVAFVGKVVLWEGEPFNKEPDKHSHIIWSEIDSLPASILPRHTLMISNIRRGILYAQEGW